MHTYLELAQLRSCDVVIVGSGAAGLLAAHEISRRDPGASVLIVDAGADLTTRSRASGNQMFGYGGAGLYLGGRLYLGSSTIPLMPPLTAPPNLRQVLVGDAYDERAEEVNALFTRLGATAEVRERPAGSLADAIAMARSAGLDYITSYPARLLSAPERREVLKSLLASLSSEGVRLVSGATVETVLRRDVGFEVALAPSSTEEPSQERLRIRTRALVLAPGRLGAEWLVNTAGQLETSVLALPTAAGVRVEVPSSAYAPLTDANPDPRLQLVLESDALVKTYATCPGGEVTAVTRYATLVASGVPLPEAVRHASTTFAVLVQPGASGAEREWSRMDDIARHVNERAPGNLVVQRLADVRAEKSTSATQLAGNTIRSTCDRAVAGALHDVYPRSYWSAVEEFFARIERVAPGTTIGDMLIYGPAEERFWHLPTDTLLQTDVPGLFVAGDGPGHSQGIIQAGVAGTLAGEGVARFLAGR